VINAREIGNVFSGYMVNNSMVEALKGQL